MNQFTWSMMFVSAENLLRICPKGVMSKNLRREVIYECFFSCCHLNKGYVKTLSDLSPPQKT